MLFTIDCPPQSLYLLLRNDPSASNWPTNTSSIHPTKKLTKQAQFLQHFDRLLTNKVVSPLESKLAQTIEIHIASPPNTASKRRPPAAAASNNAFSIALEVVRTGCRR